MYLKFAIILICFIASMLLKGTERQQPNKGRRILTTIACILLIVQSGFRHIAVGPDTYAYFNNYFGPVRMMSWNEVFRHFIDVYQLGEGKDAGFTFVVKLFQVFSDDYQVFLIFVAIAFFVPFCRFIYQNTSKLDDIVLAVIVYEALFYSFFSITGCRQTLATAFCLLSVNSIKNRQLFKFLLLMLCGFVCHRSCMVFIPFYWLGNVKNNKLMLYSALAFFPLLTVAGSRFTLQLATLSGSEEYMRYAEHTTSGAYTFLAFYFAIVLTCYFIATKQEQSKFGLAFNAVAMGIFFSPLTFNSAALMRIVQYFSLFLVILFPYVYNNTQRARKTDTNYIRIAFIFVFLYKIAVTPSTYAWFWEYVPAGVIFQS